MNKLTSRIHLDEAKEILDQYDSYNEEISKKRKSGYAKSIGLFLLSFSSLENSLDNSLTETINERGDEPGYRIIKYLNFRPKVDLMNDSYMSLIGFIENKKDKNSASKKLNEIRLKLIELSEFRNKIAHANWEKLDKNGFVRVKIQEDENLGIVFKKVKMTPEIIYKFTRQNYDISNKIYLFKERVLEAIK